MKLHDLNLIPAWALVAAVLSTGTVARAATLLSEHYACPPRIDFNAATDVKDWKGIGNMYFIFSHGQVKKQSNGVFQLSCKYDRDNVSVWRVADGYNECHVNPGNKLDFICTKWK